MKKKIFNVGGHFNIQCGPILKFFNQYKFRGQSDVKFNYQIAIIDKNSEIFRSLKGQTNSYRMDLILVIRVAIGLTNCQGFVCVRDKIDALNIVVILLQRVLKPYIDY